MITQAVDSIAAQAGIDLEMLHTATLTADGKVELQKEQEQATIGAAGEKARTEIKERGRDVGEDRHRRAGAAEDEIHEKITAAAGAPSTPRTSRPPRRPDQAGAPPAGAGGPSSRARGHRARQRADRPGGRLHPGVPPGVQTTSPSASSRTPRRHPRPKAKPAKGERPAAPKHGAHSDLGTGAAAGAVRRAGHACGGLGAGPGGRGAAARSSTCASRPSRATKATAGRSPLLDGGPVS